MSRHPKSETELPTELPKEVDFHEGQHDPGTIWPEAWRGRHYYRTTVRFHRGHLGPYAPNFKQAERDLDAISGRPFSEGFNYDRDGRRRKRSAGPHSGPPPDRSFMGDD
jgi:hypothetical protein